MKRGGSRAKQAPDRFRLLRTCSSAASSSWAWSNASGGSSRTGCHRAVRASPAAPWHLLVGGQQRCIEDRDRMSPRVTSGRPYGADLIQIRGADARLLQQLPGCGSRQILVLMHEPPGSAQVPANGSRSRWISSTRNSGASAPGTTVKSTTSTVTAGRGHSYVRRDPVTCSCRSTSDLWERPLVLTEHEVNGYGSCLFDINGGEQENRCSRIDRRARWNDQCH